MNLTRRKFTIGLGLGVSGILAGVFPSGKGSREVFATHIGTLTVDFGNGKLQTFRDLPAKSILGLLIASNLEISVRGSNSGVSILAINNIEGNWTSYINGIEVDKEQAGQVFLEGAHVVVTRI